MDDNRYFHQVVTLSTNPVSHLEPTDNSYCYKTEKNNHVPTKKAEDLISTCTSICIKIYPVSVVKFTDGY